MPPFYLYLESINPYDKCHPQIMIVFTTPLHYRARMLDPEVRSKFTKPDSS